MRLAPERSEEAAAWVAARIPEMNGLPFDGGSVGLPVVDSGGRILGAAVYSSYQPHHGTLAISAAADDARWLAARAAIRSIFDYAFTTCDVQKLWAITADSNLRTQRLLAGWGFVREAELTRHYGAGNALLYRLFREQYGAGRRSTRGLP